MHSQSQSGNHNGAGGGSSKNLVKTFNLAAKDRDKAAIPPQPKLDREPPKKSPDYPTPSPVGLSESAKANEIASRREKLQKFEKEKNNEKQKDQDWSLTREFNRRS